MWQCAAESNNAKALRILVVTFVTLCIIVIYVKQSITFSSHNDIYQVSRNRTNVTTAVSVSSYSKENSKAADVDLNSVNARVAVVKQTTLIEDGSNKTKTFKTLLNSKSERYEIDSLKSTNLKRVSNALVIPQNRNRTNVRSTSPTEVLPRDVHVYSGTNRTKFQQISFTKDAKNTMLPYFQTFDKTAYDIMNMDPITFNPAFKTPCWRGKDSFAPLKDGKLHCLPYFYIMGVKKSGTTDLHSRLQSHPEYCKPLFAKESQWFARARFGSKRLKNNKFQQIIQRGIDARKVEFFVSLFDTAASCISLQPTRSATDSVTYKMVTAEASPSTFHMHTNWVWLPGNENLTEPRYTNFHYIKKITPNAKILILFRDPTTRLYSDFLHTTRGKYGLSSPKVFHRHVTVLLKAYSSCFHHFSQRSCVYNNALKQELRSKRIKLAESFNAGFYAVLMSDLLAVFGKAQLLPILMNDYVTNMEKTLRNAFSFLDMSAVNSTTMQLMLKMNKKNVSKKKKKVGVMLEETLDMLYKFYRPYNEDMAALMNDTRYLFS